MIQLRVAANSVRQINPPFVIKLVSIQSQISIIVVVAVKSAMSQMQIIPVAIPVVPMYAMRILQIMARDAVPMLLTAILLKMAKISAIFNAKMVSF